MQFRLFILGLFLCFNFYAQDTTYARKVIKFLTSEKCYGRGYLKDGLLTAAKYISAELKSQQVIPLFSSGYFQPFTFNVNTFPGNMSLSINGKHLTPGVDYIPDPESAGLKGEFKLIKKDSVSFVSEDQPSSLKLSLKKKLTYSVAQETAPHCGIQLLNKNGRFNDIHTAKLNIENKLIENFKNNNVCGYIEGTEKTDSLIVFSAHYDHLGGIGKHTFFPGANDNASGVSVLLNLARHYKLHPPKYRTLFVFFAGEEAGLMGSQFFVQNKTVPLQKIKFLINLDLLGTGDDGIMVVNGAILEKQFNLLTQINSETGLVKEIKKRGKAKNSDHYWFTEAGVPAFFIYTMGGVTSYHDVYDIEKTLPLTDYTDILKLIVTFADKL